MKRFFGVFSIIMLIFLVLAAGSLAVMQYFAVTPGSGSLQFVGGWGVTAIYYDPSVSGDLFLIKPAPAGIVSGAVLYTASDGRLRAGKVTGGDGTTYQITSIGGVVQQVPVKSVKAVYLKYLRHLASLINALKTPMAVGVFAAVQVFSILLWIMLPGRGERRERAERAERKTKPRAGSTLSEHDGDISSTIL